MTGGGSLLDNRHGPLTGASGDYVDGMWHRKKMPNPYEAPKELDPIQKLANAMSDIEDLKSAVASMGDQITIQAAEIEALKALVAAPEPQATPAPPAPEATVAPSLSPAAPDETAQEV
jgi:hypothetical protein